MTSQIHSLEISTNHLTQNYRWSWQRKIHWTSIIGIVTLVRLS